VRPGELLSLRPREDGWRVDCHGISKAWVQGAEYGEVITSQHKMPGGGGTKELSDYGSDYKQAGTRRETMANDEGEGLEPSQCCLRLETEDGVHHESSRPCLLKDRRRRPEGGE
jgi:hypothetical protein